jgi:hypothetical protein
MFRVLAVVSVAVVGCSSTPDEGGQWVSTTEAPNVVNLTDGSSMCTGAKVGARVFLTARHCDFRIGALDISHADGEDSVTVKVEDLVTAPAEASMTAYDLAFFVVDRDTPSFPPAQFRVAPRAFPRPAIGFGLGCNEDKLRRFTLRTIPDAEFVQLYPALRAETAPIARFDGPDGACEGDSGAPLFDDEGVIVGVVSRRRGDTPEDARTIVAAKTDAWMADLLRTVRVEREHPAWRDLQLRD